MSKIDLHIHSKFSDDGELSPKEIVRKCKKQGMVLISITDHNSVRGIDEALDEADEIRVVSGVELDCTYGGRNFHLLGYGFDHTRKEFNEIEKEIVLQERAAAEEKIRLFRKASGIPLSVMEILAASENGIVTGEFIAEMVLRSEAAGRYEVLKPYLPGGEKSDMPNVRFYWDFFSAGKPAYVPIQYLSLPDAAELIHGAGGIAVLAHPGQNLKLNDPLLPSLLSEKLDGIEAFSSYHTQERVRYYLDVAKKENLLVTCGSDFHGMHKPQIQLGGHGAVWSDEKLMAGVEILKES